MKIIRLSVVIWMVLWLVGNGALAAVMPFCQHALGHHGDHTVAAPHHEHEPERDSIEHGKHVNHHEHDASQTNLQSDPLTGVLGFICDNCNLCHLASSVVPTENVSHFLPEPNRCFGPSANLSFELHFPEPPQHVPLSHRV